jgi:hypothetical protein
MFNPKATVASELSKYRAYRVVSFSVVIGGLPSLVWVRGGGVRSIRSPCCPSPTQTREGEKCYRGKDARSEQGRPIHLLAPGSVTFGCLRRRFRAIAGPYAGRSMSTVSRFIHPGQFPFTAVERV